MNIIELTEPTGLASPLSSPLFSVRSHRYLHMWGDSLTVDMTVTKNQTGEKRGAGRAIPKWTVQLKTGTDVDLPRVLHKILINVTTKYFIGLFSSFGPG